MKEDVTTWPSIEERSVHRALAPFRERYQQEVQQLIEAGHRVMRRAGYGGATVADILAEAGLSTRAFYRHFKSKDELLLAMYERDSETSLRRLAAALADAASPLDAFGVWLDEQLTLVYETRHARRTAIFLRESARLHAAYPEETVRIDDRIRGPLVDILRRGRDDGSFQTTDPERDARTVQAVVWSIAGPRVLRREPLEPEDARAYILRFCLSALGAKA